VVPESPVAGQPFTLIPSWPEGQKGPYAWDLDGQPGCETEPTAEPTSVTLTLAPGEYRFHNCADGWICLVVVTVDDGKGLPDFYMPEIDASHLYSRGADVTWPWMDTAPTGVTYSASFRPADDSGRVPLDVRAENNGDTTLLTIAPPPPGAQKPPQGMRLGALNLKAQWANDPSPSFPSHSAEIEKGIRAHSLRDPCPSTFPGDSSTTSGGVTVYSREASERLVCQGFGAREGFKWTVGMSCAVISALLSDRAALTVDFSCAIGELAQDPNATTELSVACGTLADILGARYLAAGRFAGFLCASAPSAGEHLEATHESDVARDVVNEDKCLQYRRGRLGVSWAAVPCKPSLSGTTASLTTGGRVVAVDLFALAGEAVTGELRATRGPRAAGNGPALLGLGTQRFSEEGPGALNIRLNRRGRRILRRDGRLRATLKLSARVNGRGRVTRIQRLSLERRRG
jgi:hypothetical protein